MTDLMDMMGIQKKNNGMGAGMGLILGIGIGTALGLTVGTFMAYSKGNQNSSFGGSTQKQNNSGNLNYEFGQESGIGGLKSGSALTGSASGKNKTSSGYGQNYGLNGNSSGLFGSGTNQNNKNK